MGPEVIDELWARTSLGHRRSRAEDFPNKIVNADTRPCFFDLIFLSPLRSPCSGNFLLSPFLYCSETASNAGLLQRLHSRVNWELKERKNEPEAEAPHRQRQALQSALS